MLENRYLPTKLAARHLTVATSTIIRWRREHFGPTPIRISRNRVVYDMRELDRFMEERASFERQPTAPAAHP
jgi:hypothetical protein